MLTNANLIPYEPHPYPLQPAMPEKTVVMSQDSIAHHYRFQQPTPDKMTAAIHRSQSGNRYDRHQCLHYADDYQVGRIIDLYA